jgi:hypothetical protein
MTEPQRDELASLAAELRVARDELAAARHERAQLIRDLEALQARLVEVERQMGHGAPPDRAVANDEFLDRQRREQVQVARLRRLARPFRGLPGFDAVERTARRVRARRRS